MTLPDVVLHIGQPKTGTTTFQNVLAQDRRRLRETGILYPDLGQANQWLAMGEILLADPDAQTRLPAGLRSHLTELLAGVDGQFARLAQQCRDFAGSRIVISAENLVYAGAHTVDRLYDAFGPTRSVTVVVTTKPVSALLGSGYQQLARTQAVADFDDWVRTAIDELLTHPESSTVGWARTDVLRKDWTRPGWRTTLVDMSGHPQSTTTTLWRLVIPQLPCPDLADVDNRSYPAALVAANQAFIRRHPHLTVARFQQIQREAFAAHLRDPDYGALGRFSLLPDVAALLDRAFPHAEGGEVDDHAVDELQQRLRSTEPLTRVDLAPETSQRDFLAAVATLTTLLRRVHKPLLTRRTVRRVRTGLQSLRGVVAAK
jgi:hypothetical protein